jgi:hypothetical protein
LDLLEDIPQSYVSFAAVRKLWQDVEWLASRLRAADDQRSAWHHFLLACGNFKRPGGTKIHPWALTSDDWVRPIELPSRIEVPDGRTLSVDDPRSWRLLSEARGIRIPTATTVLSALWPGRHAIMDARSKNAALGWAILDGVEVPPVPAANSHGAVPTGWNVYVWYREFVLSKTTGSRDALFIERCLYRLDADIRERPDYRALTWGEYAVVLERAARRVAENPRPTDRPNVASIDTLKLDWLAVLDAVRGMSRVTHTHLRMGVAIEVDDERLLVAFDNASHTAALREPEHAERVAAALRSVYGRDLRLELVLTDRPP